MFPFAALSSETSAANLLKQIRWRGSLQCPRCRSSSVIKYGSCRAVQRYLCGLSAHSTINPPIFACTKIVLDEWLFAIYVFVRFNTSIRKLTAELDLPYKTLHRHVEHFTKALDAPSIELCSPTEIDELYVPAGLKGPEPTARRAARSLNVRAWNL